MFLSRGISEVTFQAAESPWKRLIYWDKGRHENVSRKKSSKKVAIEKRTFKSLQKSKLPKNASNPNKVTQKIQQKGKFTKNIARIANCARIVQCHN